MLSMRTADLLVLAVTLVDDARAAAAHRATRRTRRAGSRPRRRPFDAIDGDTTARVIIAGFGRFGQIVARVLRIKGIPFTALDSSQTHVDFVRRFGNQVYYGDASRLDLLRAAGAAARASWCSRSMTWRPRRARRCWCASSSRG